MILIIENKNNVISFHQKELYILIKFDKLIHNVNIDRYSFIEI